MKSLAEKHLAVHMKGPTLPRPPHTPSPSPGVPLEAHAPSPFQAEASSLMEHQLNRNLAASDESPQKHPCPSKKTPPKQLNEPQQAMEEVVDNATTPALESGEVCSSKIEQHACTAGGEAVQAGRDGEGVSCLRSSTSSKSCDAPPPRVPAPSAATKIHPLFLRKAAAPAQAPGG